MVKNISIVMIKLVMVKNVPIIIIKLVTVRNIPIVMIICQRVFITRNIELSENETIFASFMYILKLGTVFYSNAHFSFIK